MLEKQIEGKGEEERGGEKRREEERSPHVLTKQSNLLENRQGPLKKDGDGEPQGETIEFKPIHCALH